MVVLAETDICPGIAGKGWSRAVSRTISAHGELGADWLISALAELQHGVVARAQLLAAGLGAGAIDHRLKCGRLRRIHQGVYAVGHRRLSARGWWMAGVLACGEGAALSHLPAAQLLGVRPGAGRRTEVTSRTWRRSRRGLIIHCGRLPPDEITELHGIPVTTVPRTIFDLAAIQGRDQVENALHEADVRRLWDALSLHDLIARYPGRRGAATIRAILRDRDYDRKVTGNTFERAFRRFATRFELPVPEFNTDLVIRGRELQPDCLWPEQRLMVELDGFAVHGTRQSFESDRERDRFLQVAGWRIVRITWRQLRRGQRALARDLSDLLSLPSLRP